MLFPFHRLYREQVEIIRGKVELAIGQCIVWNVVKCKKSGTEYLYGKCSGSRNHNIQCDAKECLTFKKDDPKDDHYKMINPDTQISDVCYQSWRLLETTFVHLISDS